ncbi:hypothetical protein ETAA8_17710 [Anatilimnocola aggregata]|uniref:Uncharacterized protein n=1 Tax=Anatilimnocola aggregata TaxID=2528021 RepID=A0A517Y8Y3_9BACT|nr:hypothetical protein [Anatilimnocola aggregata]QDU26690.1 hypothetical protein ETAA8_17710 [Anatilimnocola aggregata]
MLKNVKYAALSAVALLVSVPFLLDSTAQEGKLAPSPAAVAATPPASSAPDLYDPAFDRYVDLMMLGRAWDQLDAALMTDCALQLAEGERILMRSHKAVSSKQLLELASKVAADKRDLATLDRLAKVCESTKNTEALTQVTAARKLAGASRKIDPAMSLSVAETSPEQLALYQNAINGARGAGIVGDASYFENLDAGLNDKTSVLGTLSESQRVHLKRIMGEARSAMPKEGDQPLSETLTKLKQASRGPGIGGILHGVSDIVNGGHHGGGYGGHHGGYGGGYGGHHGGGYGGHHGGYGGGYGGHHGGGYGGHHGGGHHGGGHGWHP